MIPGIVLLLIMGLIGTLAFLNTDRASYAMAEADLAGGAAARLAQQHRLAQRWVATQTLTWTGTVPNAALPALSGGSAPYTLLNDGTDPVSVVYRSGVRRYVATYRVATPAQREVPSAILMALDQRQGAHDAGIVQQVAGNPCGQALCLAPLGGRQLTNLVGGVGTVGPARWVPATGLGGGVPLGAVAVISTPN